MHKILVFACVLAAAAVAQGSVSEGPDFTHGLQIIGKVFRHFINSQPEDLKLSDGVHIVNTASPNDATARAAEDATVLGSVENFLKTHELRIRLPELMPNGEDFGRALKDVVGGVDSNDVGTGRGKNKGGGGGGALLLLGSMFASMLGALGIGGVGLLAMKALAVSGMALMLAAIVGVKKLASSGHDDGGHHVIHASGGHGYEHRRKREAADLAYSAWDPYNSS